MSKPKLWEDNYLSSAVELTTQITNSLQLACEKNNLELDKLPDSIINSELLYHIAACYNTLYDLLLEQDLKTFGSSKLDLYKQQLN